MRTRVRKLGGSILEINPLDRREHSLSLSRGISLGKQQLEKMIFDHQLDLLAELEMEPNIAISGDQGKPFIYFYNKLPAAQSLMEMVLKVLEKIEG